MLAVLFSAAWGYWLNHGRHGGNVVDFRAVYYGARTAINHHDPYSVQEFLQVYRQEGGTVPAEPARMRGFMGAVPICVNLPSTLLVVSPFAALGWAPALIIWMSLLTAGLAIAAWLILDLAGNRAPAFALTLACVILANCQNLMQIGNSSGVAVSLCIVGVWCFFKQRYKWLGIVCFALGLALKPTEVAPICLFLLLARGAFRRRAWQVSALALVLFAIGTVWVAQVSPHWFQEWRMNVAATSGRGELNDPGPTSFGNGGAGMIVSLQSLLSFFRDDPHFYNPAALLLAGGLLLVWCIITFRSHLNEEGRWLALASLAPLSLLPVYHRQYDTKLLLLCIPACAALWASGVTARKAAAAFCAIGIVLTCDISSAALIVTSKGLHLSQDHLAGKFAAAFMTRSPVFGLLLVSGFSLGAYIQHARLARAKALERTDPELEMVSLAS
ncbi:glycosyltransferase family 87 protein [Occallatibacter riparius]|uniref:DUF2029 domain-containing protein n=1 Tax=Occallatibacter riparius TaxID=1002689 RepID=A0A9J7BKG6_9BACT|nr:glycosyltransferase family 87 protein [Occallatibacter riparius]UWZ83083.1 DUF2029 domain-containing protein [Occallatibacter riparius]